MTKLLSIPAIALTLAFLGCAADPGPAPEANAAAEGEGMTYTLEGIPHEVRANSLAEKVYDKRVEAESPSEVDTQKGESFASREKKRTALLVAKLEARLEALEAEFLASTDPAIREVINLRMDLVRSELKEAQFEFHRARLWEGNSLPEEPVEHPIFPPDSD